MNATVEPKLHSGIFTFEDEKVDQITFLILENL